MRRLLSHTSVVFVLLAGLVPGVALGAAKRASATASSAHARAMRVVLVAVREIGVQYRYGGISPRTGFDCSGFTRWVFSHVGVALPHSSYAQFSLGRRISMGALRPGDLVFFDGVGHVGIYIGSGFYVNAPHAGAVVRVESLQSSLGRYDGARRLG